MESVNKVQVFSYAYGSTVITDASSTCRQPLESMSPDIVHKDQDLYDNIFSIATSNYINQRMRREGEGNIKPKHSALALALAHPDPNHEQIIPTKEMTTSLMDSMKEGDEKNNSVHPHKNQKLYDGIMAIAHAQLEKQRMKGKESSHADSSQDASNNSPTPSLASNSRDQYSPARYFLEIYISYTYKYVYIYI